MRFRPILVVDDSPADMELVRGALTRAGVANPIVTLAGGDALLAWMHGQQAPTETPIAIFLDLRMPRIDGLQALRSLRAHAELNGVPVVMLTGSSSADDMVESYAAGANSYVVKAGDIENFARDLERLGRYWGSVNQPPLALAQR
jgi:CheY-like chemotaxis protein